MSLLRAYAWPGNVRELQNICERAVVLCRGETIGPDLVHPWLHGPAPGRAMPKPEIHTRPAVPPASVLGQGIRPLEEIERQAIIETLERFNGHRQKTAEALGIGVRTLGLKLKKWKDAQLVSDAL
jgi:DNA-binding NtrC family response regulator